MYHVVIIKEDPHSSVEMSAGFYRKTFDLYLETAENVCALIQSLDEWNLRYHLDTFEFSKCDVIDVIKKDLDLK